MTTTIDDTVLEERREAAVELLALCQTHQVCKELRTECLRDGRHKRAAEFARDILEIEAEIRKAGERVLQLAAASDGGERVH